jgi:hypothetical protein
VIIVAKNKVMRLNSSLMNRIPIILLDGLIGGVMNECADKFKEAMMNKVKKEEK